MDKSIKGITIELGADTTSLGDALKDITKQSVSLSQELKQVEKGLKFDPGNAELVAQKQQILAEQVATTTEKLNKLKDAQAQVEQKFSEGKISAEQYRAFNREVVATETALKSLQTQMSAIETEQDQAAKSTKQLETLFEATGTSVDNFASVLGGRLVNAIKDGTATSKQLDDAINKIGVEALGTKTDLEKMKTTLDSVDDGNSVENVRKELGKLSQEAEQTKSKIKELDIDLENMLGAAIAGGGISGAIEQALDTSKLKTKIDITFNVPEESKKSVEEAVRGIEAYGVDAEASLEGVRKQWALNKTASDEANTAIVKSAAVIASSYDGIDFTELIQETNEIASELGISQEGALGLVDALFKIGFPPDQLDIVAEYGSQLTRAGYSAEEVQAIMAAGVETGTWNIDNLLDGLKEGRIKAAEFGQGVDDAMKQTLEGTNISAEQLEKWGQSVAKGGKEGSTAMTEIAKALVNVEDETKRNELGVKLFGTMWEDQGQNITNTLIDASNKTIDFKKNQDDLNESVKKMDASPAVKMQQAFANLKIALEPVLEVVTSVISKFAEFISENPKLAATLATIATIVGIVAGAAMALAPIFVTLTSVMTALGVGAGIAAGIVALVPIIIAAVIALVVAITQNWDSIREWTINTWNAIVEFLTNLWNSIVEIATTVWTAIVEAIKSVWISLSEFFTTLWTGIVEFLIQIFQGISDLFVQIWTGISEFFMGIWNGIIAFLTPIVQGIASFLEATWNVISTVVQSVWNFISQYLQAIWNAILYFVKPVFEDMKNFLSGIWDAIKTATSTAWDAIKRFLETCWNAISSVMKPIFDAIKSFISDIWDKIKSTTSSVWDSISSVLSGVWNGIKTAASSVFDGIKTVITTVWDTVSNASSNVWNGIKSTLSGIWDGIKSAASTVWDGVKSAIMTPVDAIASAVPKAFDGMKSSAINAWEGLKSGIKVVINGIISIINAFIDGFNTPANLLNKIPGVDAPTIPHVPMLATGGHVLGDGQFIAGEAGPELFTKKGNKVSVTPLSSREKSLGITGSINQLVNDMRKIIGDASKTMRSNNSITSNQSITIPNNTTIENNYNMTFNSPKALDPYETARMNRNALRELALQV
ncbi:DUF2207 domain-containing protein [Bacillus sp. S13(2024)]|uniref:phage tail protein n=1 Tax=unclassified Bacillus (in: firmicutes) TaxID=185979 RepID=UPI003D25AE6A